MNETPIDVLDVRETKCPLNFVKTRLALEKIPLNKVLEVWIAADSESVMNIPQSIQAEGHRVIRQECPTDDPGTLRLWIQRLK
jgi:tRNA 2-thiouridine synthesizing protein A